MKPYVPDAWMDREKDRVGYEIPFTRYFYKYLPPRPLKEIDADLAAVTEDVIANAAWNRGLRASNHRTAPWLASVPNGWRLKRLKCVD